jgi:hypothetical protein
VLTKLLTERENPKNPPISAGRGRLGKTKWESMGRRGKARQSKVRGPGDLGGSYRLTISSRFVLVR